MAYADEVLADAPAAYYRMDETSGTTLVDASGGGWNGTYTGSPTLGAPGLVGSGTAVNFGEANQAAYAVSGYAGPNGLAITVEFWFKKNSVVTDDQYKEMVTHESSGSNGFAIQMRPTTVTNAGALNFIRKDTAANDIFTTNKNLCDGVPHHVVFVLDQTTLTAYIDGAVDSTFTTTGTLRSNTDPFRIGRGYYAGGYIQGTLDEVAVYTTALSAARVTAHYNAGHPPPALTLDTVAFTGDGTLTAATTPPAATTTAAFSGDGVLAATVQFASEPDMTIAILDDVVRQAPTPITVVLVEGVPEAAVDFSIDGTFVWSGQTDSDGYLAPTSINVPEELGAAGVHTLTAVQAGAHTGSATFTIQRDPAVAASNMGPDAQAVDVPGAVDANGVRHWVLQDLLPGGLGSWIMPTSPREMSSPYLDRAFNAQTTTAGYHHVTEGARAPVDWTFRGFASTEEFAEKLLAYGDLNRRLYVIDHRGRAFKVVLTNVDLRPRLRRTLDGQLVDGHDYEVHALVIDQEWVTPA